MVKHMIGHRGLITLVALIVAFVTVLAPASATPALASSHAVRVGSLTLGLGDQGAVDLDALNMASPGLASWNIDVIYDESVVTALSCTASLVGINVCNPAFAADTVRVAGATAVAPIGDVTLATITFRCVAEGSASLSILVQNLSDATSGDPQPISAATEDGTITCGKDAGGDTDGDTLINSTDLDDDGDGCTDVQELGPNPVFGGVRNPHYFWDFYDPNSDRSVTVSDFFALLQRFAAVGDETIDPLSTPPQPPAYHPRFDRGPTAGVNAWDAGPADGAITTTDFFSLLAQFGHTCG